MEKTIKTMYSLQKNTEQQLDEIIPILVDKIVESKNITDKYFYKKDYIDYYLYLNNRQPTSKDILMVMKNLYRDLIGIQDNIDYEHYVVDNYIKNPMSIGNGMPQYTLSWIKLYDRHEDCLKVQFVPHSTRVNTIIVKDEILVDIYKNIMNKKAYKIKECE